MDKLYSLTDFLFQCGEQIIAVINSSWVLEIIFLFVLVSPVINIFAGLSGSKGKEK